ncbi:unnamed protein product [Bathycoccus prasinos]
MNNGRPSLRCSRRGPPSELQLSKTATQNVAGDMLVSKSLFRAPRNGVATVHHAVSWKHKTSPQQD